MESFIFWRLSSNTAKRTLNQQDEYYEGHVAGGIIVTTCEYATAWKDEGIEF